MKKYIFILSSAMFFFACKDHTEPDQLAQAIGLCLNVSTHNNPENRGAEYADFTLAGKHVVMSDGHDDYKQVNDIWGNYITEGPILQPTNGARQLWLGFDNTVIDTIELNSTGITTSYKFTDDQLFLILSGGFEQTLVEFIDSHFKLGDLPLQTVLPTFSEKRDSTDAFVLRYMCICDCSGDDRKPDTWHRLETTSPAQSGYVRCTTLDRFDQGDSVRYKMKFEMNCDMFKVQTETTAPEYRDHLKGKMAVDFTVKK